MTLQEIGIDFQRRTRANLLERAQLAVEHLLAQIQEAYKYPVVIGSHGGAGAIGSLQTAIKNSGAVIEAVIGPSAAGAYFRWLEYGVRPASSDPSAGPPMQRIPPVLKIMEWTRLARLQVPEKFMPKDRRSSGEVHSKRRASGFTGEAAGRRSWAFAIARNRKKHGYKGLHIIIKVAQREAANIRKILEEGITA